MVTELQDELPVLSLCVCVILSSNVNMRRTIGTPTVTGTRFLYDSPQNVSLL